MGKPQPAVKAHRVDFDKQNLYEKLNTKIREAVSAKPCCEDVGDEDEDWGSSKTGEYPIFDLLRASKAR